MERNVIIATAPSTHPRFGGIRVRDGRGILVANNRVIGPWTNAISATDVIEAVIEQNDLEATQFAIAFGLNRVEPALLISVSNTVVRNNRIEGAGTAGVFVFEACYNTLFGNAFKLDRNVDGVA
ncbi:MAG TPA: right-handed parallel beta-helix repeat-containing protein, partial [Longimicrobiales bacterium]|nr:right-handed parallel beta-helix repeat-containing protein [Longimicrobiales bacterium]